MAKGPFGANWGGAVYVFYVFGILLVIGGLALLMPDDTSKPAGEPDRAMDGQAIVPATAANAVCGAPVVSTEISQSSQASVGKLGVHGVELESRYLEGGIPTPERP